MAKSRKKLFEDKRIKTFSSLKTKNKDWTHAKVRRFSHVVRHNRSGKLIEEWIPEYDIPIGYENPFETDVLVSDKKHCQLCDTNIINYGVILHLANKQFLIVGLECYVIYESDSDRALKLELLTRQKNEYVDGLLKIEKAKILAGVKKITDAGKRLNIDYRTHSDIVRDRWRSWSKVKFNNFVVKHASELDRIDYEPNEQLGIKPYHAFYKNILETINRSRLFVAVKDFIINNTDLDEWNIKYHVHYSYSCILDDKGNTILDKRAGIIKAINNLSIDNLKRGCKHVYNPIDNSNWKFDEKSSSFDYRFKGHVKVPA